MKKEKATDSNWFQIICAKNSQSFTNNNNRNQNAPQRKKMKKKKSLNLYFDSSIWLPSRIVDTMKIKLYNNS